MFTVRPPASHSLVIVPSVISRHSWNLGFGYLIDVRRGSSANRSSLLSPNCPAAVVVLISTHRQEQGATVPKLRLMAAAVSLAGSLRVMFGDDADELGQVLRARTRAIRW
ncbi:hypothetical protein OKW38_000450 [Paraburkholderia sp. MM5496-R1]|uniref:hypothetical protein n=1 Tax=unclassified Paraburkholderia TaxID=2615204 RepID=UPI003D1AA3B2